MSIKMISNFVARETLINKFSLIGQHNQSNLFLLIDDGFYERAFPKEERVL